MAKLDLFRRRRQIQTGERKVSFDGKAYVCSRYQNYEPFDGSVSLPLFLLIQVSYACPWAHRTLLTRALKGLQDTIDVTVVHPTWKPTKPDKESDGHTGWIFGDPDGKPFRNSAGRGGPFEAALEDTSPDPIYNSYSIRELYERAGDINGKYTVPILWDKVGLCVSELSLHNATRTSNSLCFFSMV